MSAPMKATDFRVWLERQIESAELPAQVASLLRDVASESADDPPAAVELLEELIDHFQSGLERGVPADQLIGRFVHADVDARELAAAARLRRALLDQESERAPGLFDLLVADLVHASRTVVRSPGFSLGNIATLALGIGAAVALFSLLQTVLLRPLPFVEPEELFYVREESADGRRLYPSYPNFDDWRQQEEIFDGVVSTTWGGWSTVLGADRALRVRGLGVSRGFFETLGVRPIVGRSFAPEETVNGGPGAVLVSEELWRRELGASLDLDGLQLVVDRERYQVIGVVPRDFRLLEPADLYLNHDRHPGTIRGAHAYQVIVRLADGVSREQAEHELDRLAASIKATHGDDTEAVGTAWTPLRERIVGTFDGVVAALFAASLLVLLVACSDVGASLLARGRRRSGEMALRRSLGASPMRIASQLGAEVLLIVVPALVLGSVLASSAISWVRRFASDQIPRTSELAVDPGVLLFALGLGLATTALCSLFSIRQALRSSAGRVARSGLTAKGPHRLGWGLFIGSQITIAFLLLVGATLLFRTLDRVKTHDSGFDVAGVAAAHVHLPPAKYPTPEERLRFTGQIREELASLPGVEVTALANLLPYDWGAWSAPVVSREQPEEWLAMSGWRLVTPEYFSLLEIPLLEGSTLPDNGLVEGTTAAVINASLAQRLAGEGSAVGRVVRCNFDPRFEWLTVVGVVGEARHWRAERGSQPEIYVHQQARPEAVTSEIVLLETSGSPRDLFRAARQRLVALDPDVPVELVALTDTLKETLERERLAASVLGVFAVIVLILTLVGIVGVVARAVAERRHEAGIRQALGATPSQVVRLLQAEVLIPVIGGAAAGIVLTAIAARSLESLLFGVEPTDIATYLAATSVVGVAVFVASLWPARRVIAENPVTTLRAD